MKSAENDLESVRKLFRSAKKCFKSSKKVLKIPKFEVWTFNFEL